MTTHSIRLGLLAGAVALAAFAGQALAEDYPSKPIEVIHQFGPGGGTDSFIRALGLSFEEISKVQLIPIAISGGAGVPAAAAFAQRPADGQTMQAIGPEEVISHVMGRVNLDDYQPVARIQYDQGLFYVGKSSEFTTIQEVVDFAKANPGKLKIGITGTAGFDAALLGLWNNASGAELTAVPFKGTSETLAATLGGHVDLIYEEFGPSRGVVESGELRPLVVFAEQRLPELPDVPTAQELGYDVTLGRWRGLALKAGDDPAQAARLTELFKAASETPEYQNIEQQNALQYRSVFLGPEEFKAFLDEEIETYTTVLSQITASR